MLAPPGGKVISALTFVQNLCIFKKHNKKCLAETIMGLLHQLHYVSAQAELTSCITF